MVKIIFELDEEFIKEHASEENLIANVKGASGDKVLKHFFDSMGFQQLKKEVEKGTTEFVVTPDKLDDMSKRLYNNKLGEICMLAVFSERDNDEE